LPDHIIKVLNEGKKKLKQKNFFASIPEKEKRLLK
jgi:hypothetical protein